MRQHVCVSVCVLLLTQSILHVQGFLRRAVRSHNSIATLLRAATNPASGAYDFKQWSKAFVSQPNEFDYEVEEIEGTIPLDLPAGVLYRAMPALFERGGRSYGHYLDGDGYIVSLSLSPLNNKARFKSKFVKTEEYKKESEANKILYRGTFRTQKEQADNFLSPWLCTNNAFDLKLKNLGNTNVLSWGKRLLALFEAGVPHRLDPYTLDTIGMDDMNVSGLQPGMSVLVPALKKAFPQAHDALFGASMTAHPKIDSTLNRLVGWIWRAQVGSSPLDTNPAIEVIEWDTGLVPVQTTSFTLTNTNVAPHDFSITKNYYCFIENRMGGNTLPYLLGKVCPAECVNITPSEDMILNLVHRNAKPGSDAPKVVKVPLKPGFSIHSTCAFENEATQTLELFTSEWDTEAVKKGVSGGFLGSWAGTAPDFDSIPCTYLYHTIIDLEKGALISHAPFVGMESTIIEHPHINPRFEGKQLRYLYMSVGSQEGISSPPLGYLRLDLKTGKKQIWYANLHTYCEEVVVVPKTNGVLEDDVWLLVSMFDAVRNRSCVALIDGKDVSKGPVCTMHLRHHLPHSLHGCFQEAV